MNVSLTPELGRWIQERVQSGLYTSASEVVREALRLLREHDELRQARREELRRLVHEGIADADAARVEEATDAFLDSVLKEGREGRARHTGR